jgi:hypothetical protein
MTNQSPAFAAIGVESESELLPGCHHINSVTGSSTVSMVRKKTRDMLAISTHHQADETVECLECVVPG